MSLFSFGDIKFNKGDLTRKGPLSALTKSEYETNNLRYPIDVGNADKGHYMVFYVRKQKKTTAGGGQNPVSPEALVPTTGAIDGLSAKAKSLVSGGVTTNFGPPSSLKIPGASDISTSIGGDLVGKVQGGLSQIDGAVGGALSGIQSSLGKVSGNIQGGLKNIFGSTTLPKGGDSAQSRSVIQNNVAQVKGGSLDFLKTTKRTSEAISLYMPDTLMFNQTQSYDQLNIGTSPIGQLMAAGGSNADAINAGIDAAKDLDIDIAEAVMRAELGSEVSSMSSKELKRDLLLFAKNNPSLFLELVSDDNVQLRNFGIKATEANILKLSQDNRNFTWASNGRKVMTVPFDEHPYSALAAFFKTDEGMEIYSNIEKRLKD